MNKSQLVAYRTGPHPTSLYRSSESQIRADEWCKAPAPARTTA
jgi:hypothetical protein